MYIYIYIYKYIHEIGNMGVYTAMGMGLPVVYHRVPSTGYMQPHLEGRLIQNIMTSSVLVLPTYQVPRLASKT